MSARRLSRAGREVDELFDLGVIAPARRQPAGEEPPAALVEAHGVAVVDDDVEHRPQAPCQGLAGRHLQEGGPDAPAAVTGGDEQAGDDTEAPVRQAEHLTGQCHDDLGAPRSQRDMADDLAGVLGHPGCESIRRRHEAVQIGGEENGIAVAVVHLTGELGALVEVRLQPWPHQHRRTMA